MSAPETRLRQAIAEVARRLHTSGWVANHDGNVSARSARGFFITPTAISKAAATPDGLARCSLGGERQSGGRPPSEVALHVGAYQAREDVRAVLHAHPPHASAFSVVGRPIEPIAMPEVIVSLGAEIPLVPLFLPKDSASAAAVGQALAHADVALLAGNGAIAVGPDLETAYLRMELLEHYAKILTLARGHVGEPVALASEAQAQLLEARKKAGLPVPPFPRNPAGRDADPEAVRRLVAEEVRRALRGTKD